MKILCLILFHFGSGANKIKRYKIRYTNFTWVRSPGASPAWPNLEIFSAFFVLPKKSTNFISVEINFLIAKEIFESQY